MEARYGLGAALLMTGHAAQGLAQWRQVLRQAPDNLQTLNDTAWVLATSSDAALRNGTEAVTLASHAVALTSGRQPTLLSTLAAAYAETGQFAKALELQNRAIDLATQQANASLAAILRARLTPLQARTPIREP